MSQDANVQWLFWRKWAIYRAEHAWRMFRATDPLPVLDVRMNVDTGLLEVTFEDGSVYLVEVGGMSRPALG